MTGGELLALTVREQGAPLSQVEFTPKVAGILGGAGMKEEVRFEEFTGYALPDHLVQKQ